MVDGASVDATLIETRKGDKIKVFKKIRRKGYRRTRGHRQQESVLRVTAIAGAGHSEAWTGEVDLTPGSELRLRARNLARVGDAARAHADAKAAFEHQPAPAKVKPVAKAKPEKKAVAKVKPEKKAAPAAKTAAKKAAAPKAAAKKPAAKKAPKG
jgi:large subunit ribosomal protein L21